MQFTRIGLGDKIKTLDAIDKMYAQGKITKEQHDYYKAEYGLTPAQARFITLYDNASAKERLSPSSELIEAYKEATPKALQATEEILDPYWWAIPGSATGGRAFLAGKIGLASQKAVEAGEVTRGTMAGIRAAEAGRAILYPFEKVETALTLPFILGGRGFAAVANKRLAMKWGKLTPEEQKAIVGIAEKMKGGEKLGDAELAILQKYDKGVANRITKLQTQTDFTDALNTARTRIIAGEKFTPEELNTLRGINKDLAKQVEALQPRARIAEAIPEITPNMRETIRDVQYALSHNIPEEEIKQHLIRNPKGKYWYEPQDVDLILQQARKTTRITEVIPAKVTGARVVEAIPAKAPESPLAFNPKNLRNPKSPEAINEAKKLVSRSAIAKELSDKLGVVIRHGKFRGKALGIYKPGQKIIRIKQGQLQTISHEIGHFLEEKVPNTFSKQISTKEAQALVKDLVKPKKSEAFSEFVRFYVTEPITAKARAPQFFKKFEQILDDYPEIGTTLKTAQADYARWEAQPAAAKVLSQLRFQEAKLDRGEKFTQDIHRFYKDVFDECHPIKQFSDMSAKEGYVADVLEDPYVWVRLLKGAVSRANIFLEQGTFGAGWWKVEGGNVKFVFRGKGLKDILRPVQGKPGMWQDLAGYLTAKHSVELSKKGITTGIAVKDAQQAVKELVAKYPQFPKIADELYQYQDDVLKYGLEMGCISKELYGKLTTKYKSYVPFYRALEDLEAKGFMGKKLANIRAPVYRIKGSERDIVNPLEGIIKNTYAILGAADRNYTGVLMANLVSKNPALAPLFEKVPPRMARVAQVTAKDLGLDVPGMTTQEADEIVNIFRPSFFNAKDNIVTVLIDGKPQYFKADSGIYQTLMGLEAEHIGMLSKFMSYPAKWLRAGATLSPDFAIRNPLRDTLTAACFSKFGFIPVVDTIRGAAQIAGKTEAYWLYRASGAEHAALVSLDRTMLRRTFEEIVSAHPKVRYYKNPVEMLRLWSEFGEKATRLGEFKLALARTKNPVEAALVARNITLDFSEMGSAIKVANQWIAFFNAGIRGMERPIIAFKEQPLQTSLRIFTWITLPSIVFYEINKDDPRWQEIPQWQKDLFWIVIIDDQIYRIPKPFELGVLFGSGPERFLEWTDNQGKRTGKEYIKNLGGVILPNFIPTAALPLIEAKTNYNLFRNQAIVPQSRQDMPPELQYTEYTSETSKKIGELINYPPAKIDNLINGWTGGLGRYAVSGLDEILKGTGISPDIPEPTPELADRPVIKAFVVRSPYGSSSASVNKFYDTLSEYEGGEKYLKEMLTLGNQAKYEKYKTQHPELLFQYDWEGKSFYSASARYLRRVASQLTELRKKEDLIYRDTAMTSPEKRTAIDEIEKLKTDICRQALDYLGE